MTATTANPFAHGHTPRRLIDPAGTVLREWAAEPRVRQSEIAAEARELVASGASSILAQWHGRTGWRTYMVYGDAPGDAGMGA